MSKRVDLISVLEVIADTETGLELLRQKIRDLAICGRLTDHSNPEAAQIRALEAVRTRLGPNLKQKVSGRANIPRVPTLSEYPFDLPEGWIFARIDDLGEYTNGVAFKSGEHVSSGLPIIRIQNLTNPQANFNYTKSNLKPANIAEPGDLLVSWSATLDAFVWQGPRGAVNQHIFKVEPNRAIVTDQFMYLALVWTMKRLANSDALHGLAMKHVNRGHFVSSIIPVPPIEEQKRIVAKVDELFELCAQIEKHLKMRNFLATEIARSVLEFV